MKTSFISKAITTFLVCATLVLQPAAQIVAAETDPNVQQPTSAKTPSATPGPTTEPGPKTTPGPITEPGPKTTPGPTTEPGPQSPVGPDLSTYHFNKETGLWENEHYVWDPATGKTGPRDEPKYAYVPETSTWATDEWIYNPATGKYENIPKTVAYDDLPLGVKSGSQKLQDSVVFSGAKSASDDHALSNGSGNNQFFDLFSKLSVSNYLKVITASGDAEVSSNTTAGDATSGDSSILANIINLLQSVWHMTGGKLVTFFNNIFGSVNGDILIDPDTLSLSSDSVNLNDFQASVSQTGPDSSNIISGEKSDSVVARNQQAGSIDNVIDLSAISGNAKVNQNTTAGSATSGDASINLNLVNIINSAIATGNSFFGVINIFGDFLGDVLFPEGFLDGFLAGSSSSDLSPSLSSISQTGPDSTNDIDNSQNQSISAQTNDISTINNNILANADSGEARVENNTLAGSATSGSSKTGLTLFNLTGQNVIGQNAILVLVNVFGNWVGMIMNAPTGTTGAVLGGNASQSTITTTGPSSNNIISNDNTQAADINSNAENTINNDLSLNAQSGDALITNNTQAGNAVSGDAKIGVNVLNLIGSQLSLTNWFGILFINVFGNWIGSVETAKKAPDAPSSNHNVSTPPLPANHLSQPLATIRDGGAYFGLHGASDGPNILPVSEQTLVASYQAPPADPPAGLSAKTKGNSLLNPWLIFSAVALILSLVLFAIERRGRLKFRYR